jgi:hypothetical protein
VIASAADEPFVFFQRSLQMLRFTPHANLADFNSLPEPLFQTILLISTLSEKQFKHILQALRLLLLGRLRPNGGEI